MNRTEANWPLTVAASPDDATAALHACMSPASFWAPDRIGPQVSWLEHAPFAFWLVEALRPRTLVELGTHGGFSYFAFCETVQRCGLDTRCYAVDTWRGDEHAGFYGEEVFRDVTAHNERRYSAFSTLVRSTFDDAAGHFSDGTIDLLHIDGRHFYDDVKHDFETWRPKLSRRAVVLFHDINVRERGFGVFRVWEELRQIHPSFEFLHGHGLGVLGVGTELPTPVRDLLGAAPDPEAAVHIRSAYGRLGSAIALAMRERNLNLRVDGLTAELAQERVETGAVRQSLAAQTAQTEELRGELARRGERHAADVARLTAELARDRAAAEEARRSLATQSTGLHDALSRLAEERLRVVDLEAHLGGRSADKARLTAELAGATAEIAALEGKLAKVSQHLEGQLAGVSQQKERAEAELADARTRLGTLEAKLAKQSAETGHHNTELVRAHAQAAHLGRELDTSRRALQWLMASTSWRLTRPLRRLASTSPKLAKHGRRVINSIWLGTAFRPDMHARLPALGQGGGRGRGGLPDLDRLKSLLGASHSTPEDLTADCRLLKASGLFDEKAYRATAATVSAADHCLGIGWRQGIEPGPDFEGAFLEPYYRSVGFAGPPAITYLTLRKAGWPVYTTRADAEAIAGAIRASDLFDAAGYAARLGHMGELDPALHYVLVGERMGVVPSDGFDPDYYGERYPDIGQVPVNRLHHYLASGRIEGRRTLPVAAIMEFDRSRLKPKRDTVLLISHQASRTGAPILAYNVAMRLRRKYNVVAVLLTGGDLVGDFEACCAAVVGPLAQADWHPGEIKHLVKHLLAAYPASYAIVNSIESRMVVPALAHAFVPVVLLVHEFASYTRPKSAMREGLDWATEIVFSADLVARSARKEHPSLTRRTIHVFPQGCCDLPPAREMTPRLAPPPDFARIFRPPGAEDALVVLGCGFVHIRKGVDLFLSCAAAVAAMRPQRSVRFIWIGHGYDPEQDASYSCYLADQIARSGLEDIVAIIDEIPDLEPAYAMTDVFFLSSRLDPLPNVTIDAALHGLPIVCFEGASGMADILGADASTRQCVVPHLDVHAAAAVIANLANDEPKRRQIGETLRKIAQATFDMGGYVRRLDNLGNAGVDIMRQRAQDFATLHEDPMFDADMYLPLNATRTSRTETIVDFLTRWTAVGMNPDARDPLFRRPCAGFHPQIYAHVHADAYDTTTVNPLAHFIRGGKPDGPWRHDVIGPGSPVLTREAGAAPATALHAHFHYPELVEDFLRKLAANGSRCDLLLSADEQGKARILRKAASHYRRGEVQIRVAPNRGRDIGAFLTAFAEDVGRYEIIGHVHGKRSLSAGGQADPELGDRWREFLWQNLLGDCHPMMDVVIGRLTADEKLGIVFAEDPHLVEWDENRAIAEDLAGRMGMTEPLPPFFDFPVGTMFWARTAALKPLFELKLDWDDYPQEPVPYDGTILHALERLLPFVARHAGYGFATTHVSGVTW